MTPVRPLELQNVMTVKREAALRKQQRFNIRLKRLKKARFLPRHPKALVAILFEQSSIPRSLMGQHCLNKQEVAYDGWLSLLQKNSDKAS